MRRVYEFMNLPKIKLKNHKRYGIGNYKRMETATRKCLTEYFEPYNQSLFQLMGTIFDWAN
jgi:hypothetical protein